MLIKEESAVGFTFLGIIWKLFVGLLKLIWLCIYSFLWGFAFFEVMFTKKKHYGIITKLMIYFEGKKAFKAMTHGGHK